MSIGSRGFPLLQPMDGPNLRPEPGTSPELNNRPQQTPSPSPTSKTSDSPFPTGASLPEAISFRQLEALRLGAIEAGRSANPSGSSADPSFPSQVQGPSWGQGRPQPDHLKQPGAELAELEQLLGAYEHLGQRLLMQLGRQGSALEQHRHPQQVMALGALGAHIRLGLQALAASRH